MKREPAYPMMKKVFLIVLSIWTFSNVPAQVFVGLQGGATLSKMDFTNNLNYRLYTHRQRSGFYWRVGISIFER
ncbi:MAG: hypothetical protein U5K79_06440 [Cyclobacteriaceae bacterium]|nr:hypothetical protein [Cyclobacteriaceae bacterium]